jgi:hypothetical protein
MTLRPSEDATQRLNRMSPRLPIIVEREFPGSVHFAQRSVGVDLSTETK